jgi:hypothetical protein
MNKQHLCNLLWKLNNSRPGLEFANYGDPIAYRSDQRKVAKQRKQVEELLRFIERSDSITVEAIAATLSKGRRLSLDGETLTYTAGQYYCTEYRAAIRSALTEVLWTWFRESCECDTREKIVAAFRRNFSHSIANLI